MRAGNIDIDEREISERFVRASGPGGQNVNKVATAVELRFDAARSPGLSEPVRARLLKLAGARATQGGEIVIFCDETRTQSRNREIARERLRSLIERAQIRPRPRIATRPTLGSKKRRLKAKAQRGTVKSLRGRPDTGED